MATLEDIARRAGVSIPTVSRILNPNHTAKVASAETIRRVRQISEELNYRPNGSARALITRRTQNVGILWDKRMDSEEETVFWARVMRGLMSACKSAGYECLVSMEEYHSDGGFRLPRGFMERRVDGVIVTYPLDDSKKIVQEELFRSGIPFVVIWADYDPEIWSVDLDVNPGFRQALLHLYELGHRKIGYCVYPDWQVGEYHSNRELEREINGEFNIDLVPIPVDLTKYTHQEEGHRIGEALLRGDLDITAMIMGDVISVETMRRLSQENINVPRDFSVVGLTDSVLCKWVSPNMTSIVQPLELLGQKAISLLVDHMKASELGVTLKPRHVKLPQGFVLRESTGPVPHKPIKQS